MNEGDIPYNQTTQLTQAKPNVIQSNNVCNRSFHQPPGLTITISLWLWKSPVQCRHLFPQPVCHVLLAWQVAHQS